MDTDFKKITEKVINDFIEYFCQNPMNFLYESDISSILFTRIYDKFDSEDLKIQIKPNKYKTVIKESNFKINPVKSEFPISTWFDIVIVDPDYDNEEVDNTFPNRNWDNFWHLPPKIAIEIKYCQHNERISDKICKQIKDMNKLEKYFLEHSKIVSKQHSGLAILFVQYEKYTYRNNVVSIQKDIELLKKQYKIEKFEKLKIEDGISGWIVFPDKSIYRLLNE